MTIVFLKCFFLLVFSLSFFTNSSAQIRDTLNNKVVSTNKYFNYYYSNDAWFLTDYYLTERIRAEWIFPVLSKSPISRILPSLNNSINYYGVTALLEAYTPTSITDPYIRYNDRPYAGVFCIGQMLISNNATKKVRLTSELSIGLIGPVTSRETVQKKLHHILNSPQPKGWNHQIKTDVLLNYYLKLDKGIVTLRNFAELIAFADANAGTFRDDISAGALLRFGFLNSYFQGLGILRKSSQEGKTSHRFQLYGYLKYKEKLVGHNTTMQGGIFNRTSEYTIPYGQIEKTVAEGMGGLLLSYGTLSVETAAVWMSPEFKGGRSHRYAMVNLGFCF